MRMTRKLRMALVVAAMAVGLPLAVLVFGSSNEGSGAASEVLW